MARGGATATEAPGTYIICAVDGLPVQTLGIAATASAVVSAFVVRSLLRFRLALDAPNDRSLHTTPTPRVGGLGILAGMLLGSAIAVGLSTPLIWLALFLAALSLVDDRWNLPVVIRLLGHLAAASVYVVMVGGWSSVFVLLLMILALSWMTNLYNFMDGADGLAGGMTLFGFLAYAIAAALQGHAVVAAISICTASAAAGFLLFNFPPARIFMGDVGSIPIGFLAGAIGLRGWIDGAWPLFFPLVVFAPFVVDASVTLVRRALRGAPVWKAHREHYYQRLILGGWTHRRTAIAEYLLMALCAATGLLVVFSGGVLRVIVVVALGVTLVVSMTLVDRQWRLKQPGIGA